MIKFMTDGLLLRELILDPILSNYSYLILDEIHSRSINSDLLLPLLQCILSLNPCLTLLLMSATIDIPKYKDYFDISDQNVFMIEGRSFGIDIYYLKEAVDDYVTAAVDCSLQIQMENIHQRGDVLVFMAGQEDIEQAEAILNSRIQLYKQYNNQ